MKLPLLNQLMIRQLDPLKRLTNWLPLLAFQNLPHLGSEVDESANGQQSSAPVSNSSGSESNESVAAAGASEATPAGSEANDSANGSESSAPEKTQQLVAAVSTSMAAPSGSQTVESVSTYEGLAATNKPWALSFAALAAVALL